MGNVLYISTTCFNYDFFKEFNPRDMTDIFGVELCSAKRYYPENHIKKKLDNITQNLDKNILIHNYFPVPKKSFVLNLASCNQSVISDSLNLMDKALDLCRIYNVPYYSFHPGYLYDGHEKPDGYFDFIPDTYQTYKSTLDQFIKNFEVLYDSAKNKNVFLAIENLFENNFTVNNNLRSSLNCSYGEFDEILSMLPGDVGILLDLAHLNMSAHFFGFDRYDFIENLLEKHPHRIYEIHVSANDGTFDQHLPLEPGDWQLDVLKRFRQCPGTDDKGVNVTLEARNLGSGTLLKTKALIEDSL